MILKLLKNPPIYYVDQHSFHVIDKYGKPVYFIDNHAYRLKQGQLSQLQAFGARDQQLLGIVTAATTSLVITWLFDPPLWVILTGITALIIWAIWLVRKTYHDFPDFIHDFLHKEKPIDLYLPVWQRRLLIYWTMAINFEFSRHNIKIMLGNVPKV